MTEPLHLPDLPSAGTSTARERALTDAVMFFLRDTERSRVLLLMYVIEGPELFIGRIRRAFRAWDMDEELARAVYRYLVILAGPDPHGQLGALITVRPTP